MPARITTSIWFGDEVGTRKSIEQGKTTILVQFNLNRNGMLAAPPRSFTPDLSPAGLAEAAEVTSAILRCQPYDALPGAGYDQWRKVLMRIVIEQGPNALR